MCVSKEFEPSMLYKKVADHIREMGWNGMFFVNKTTIKKKKKKKRKIPEGHPIKKNNQLTKH